ncbi:hypothetical protein D3C77_596180 [compost metagenome]
MSQVVLTAGDEQLAAGDAVAAVGTGKRSAAQQADIAAGLGLGQAHARQHFSADDAWQV